MSEITEMFNISDTDTSRYSKTSLSYDPKTGTWSPTTPSDSSGINTSPSISFTPSDTDSESVDSSSPNVDSKKEAEKQYIEAEFNILTGDLTLTPSKKSIKIKVNDTVRLEGLGRYLSGLYFVSSIRRTLSKDGGYSQTITLLKNGFGDSIKKVYSDSLDSSESSVARKEDVTPKPIAFKVGDSVRIVGDEAVYSNAHDGVKVPKWVKKKILTVDKVSDDGARVRLMPIFSWTYAIYVQKV